MKRKRPKRHAGFRFGNVLANFSPQQLIGIGSVAMSFNDAERALHELLGPCLRCSSHFEVVASRINGMEGIAAIIRAAAKNLIRLEPAQVETAKSFWADLDLSLDAFLEAKTYRDGVIHAVIFDVTTATGVQYARQDSANEVLLTTEALRWLTDTCIILAAELRDWRKVLEAGSIFTMSYEAPDPVRLPLAQSVLTCAAQARVHRTHRTSLPPKPKFPEPLFPNTPQ